MTYVTRIANKRVLAKYFLYSLQINYLRWKLSASRSIFSCYATYYEYTELISKNNQHHFNDIHMNKKVKVHAIDGSQGCMVKMIDFYLSKLPEDPKAFYLRPHKNCPDDGMAWYVNVPVCVNTLKSMLPNMSKNAGTSTRYTNHFLHATFTTRFFQSGVQEKIIQ